MSDHDLIRRGDARDILSEEGWLGRSLERIAALPAVTVGVKPLVFTEARNKMWNAQHGYRIGWNHDDRYRVKLVDRVICKSIKGFDAAVDWANKHNEARILAALETVTQPAPTAQLDAGDVKEAWEKAYWRMRSYAVHDNDCKLNKPPRFDGPCSCGLTAALEEALALISKGATEPTEYERKVAQMKKDSPNGI